MFGAHDIIANLPSSIVQENLTMVLELMYSDNERRVAQSISKQIWDILYKETVARDILQTKGGEKDQIEGGDTTNDDDTNSDTDSTDAAPSVEEDSMNETSRARRDTGNDEQDSQDKVVGDTSVVGTKD